MNRVPVQSSDIVSVGYDPATATLEIEFHSGGLYHYYDVPSSEAEALVGASSVGRYFNANIKNHYRHVRL